MSTPSSIQLTPSERPGYAHLFALADPQSTGMVSGTAAVSFFALSGLPTPVLGSIWSIADSENNGFLGPAQFSAALRLIGHAQAGKVVTEDLINDAGPMPTFKGVTLPPHLAGGPLSTPSRTSSTMVQPQMTGSGGFGQNEIKPDDRARYSRIFASAGPQGGLLDGEKAKEIFVKSKLPFDKLGAIWNLADTKARGKLDLTDFIVGMHFIQSTMNGSLTTIPASLPAGLYEKAAGGIGGGLPSSPIVSPLGIQNTGGSTGFISRQMTGSNQQFATPASPMRSNIRSPPPAIHTPSVLQPQRTGSTFPAPSSASNWAVSAADKAKSDRFFDGLDQDRQGVLEGQAAVPFFMQSGLNEATLAHIWDLSDVTQSGSLTRDEFAVAMHLINLKITGSDLPSELPATLVPPSLRGTNLPQAVNPKETDTQRDLFSLMDDDVDLPISTASAFAVPAPNSGAANRQQFKSAPTTTSGPFDDDLMGSSSTAPVTAGFGGGAMSALSPNMTGASTMSNQNRSIPRGTTEVPSGIQSPAPQGVPFGDASAEAANHRLALDSTQKSLTDLETKKADLGRSVATDANSISDLTTRLETVRMRHQTESEAVKALTERQASQALELKKLREESVREESELSRLKAEKDEIEQSLMKDREDVREMKRVVGERTKEKEALKVELEKIKKEARMQKGMVAIGKKQLSQAEGDVASIKTETEKARAGDLGEEEIEQHAEHGEVAMSPKAGGETVNREAALSPTASVRSNNPFDRLPTHAGGAAAMGAAAGVVSAAGLGAAAIAHHESSADNTSSQTVTHDDDPFGVANTSSSVATPATAPVAESTPQAAFDDSFGQFDHSTTAAPIANVSTSREGVEGGEATNVNSAFDDAFADFDSPSVNAGQGGEEAKGTQEVVDVAERGVPGSFDAVAEQPSEPTQDLPVEASAARLDDTDQPTSTNEEILSTRAPTTDEVASNADIAPPSHSQVDKGKGAMRDEENEEDSSDEEDEPEDLEKSGRHMVDSPDVLGVGKPAIESTAATASTATPAVVTNSTTDIAAEAADKYPEMPDESTTAKAPIAADSTMSSTNATLSPTAQTSAYGSAGPISASHTGTSEGGLDAFHDAYSETPASHNRDVTESSAPGSGFMTMTGHERFTTALDNSDVSQRSISPSKTRRAPPPAPVRGSTTSSSGAASAMPANLGPFASMPSSTAAVAAPAAAPSTAGGLDDFDAAFEDLGPANGGESNANGAAPTTMPGFDDAFGDADGFDFVPSFNDHARAGSGTAAIASQTQSQSQPQTGGFDGFDSAFDSSFDPAPSSSMNQQTATGTKNVSAPGSGFSFDDAFAPSEMTAAAPASSGLPPSSSGPPPTLPSRTAVSNNNPPPSNGGAGALPDDAAPVRQLCAMGFSRADVIKSLEKSNYRTDKALERLLAQA